MTGTAKRIIAAVFGLSLAYAIVRYHVFHGTPWSHFPLYTLNKAISLSGLLLIGLSRCVSSPTDRRSLGLSGLAMIMLHVPISLCILRPEYFDRFFLPNGTLRWHLELSMLIGGIGLLVLAALYTETMRRHDPQADKSLIPGYGRLALACGALHVLFQGYPIWLKPSEWYGNMPPITLIAFVSALVLIVLKRQRRT